MHALLTVFLPAAFGSALQELLYWYDFRKKLSNKTYQAQLRSVGYWTIIIAMIIATGAGALISVLPSRPRSERLSPLRRRLSFPVQARRQCDRSRNPAG